MYGARACANHAWGVKGDELGMRIADCGLKLPGLSASLGVFTKRLYAGLLGENTKQGGNTRLTSQPIAIHLVAGTEAAGYKIASC